MRRPSMPTFDQWCDDIDQTGPEILTFRELVAREDLEALEDATDLLRPLHPGSGWRYDNCIWPRDREEH